MIDSRKSILKPNIDVGEAEIKKDFAKEVE